MNQRQIGHERGKKAAQTLDKAKFQYMRKFDYDWNRRLFPTLGVGFDFEAAVLAYDKKRLESVPDAATFPELKGMADRAIGEREGFCDGTGFTPADAAHHYTFGFFIWKHINSKHVARYDLNAPPIQCTNVLFPDTAEGGVIISDNRDDVLQPHYRAHVPKHRVGGYPANHKVGPHQGGVSSAVMLDEEPSCIFPVNPWEFMPDECYNDIKDMAAFMSRYRDFWGPGNQMWVDRSLRGVMVEKANVRVAFRWPTVRGAICITACSYIDPELNAYKKSRLKLVMKHKGENEETSPDWVYACGSDERQRRLLELTNAEAKRGATLWGALNVVADHAVPFPARVCLAGEKGIPEKEPLANWSLTQHAAVITGPNRRSLYRSIQDFDNPKPVHEYTPKFELGEGVAMKPQWQADIDAGRCVWVK